MAEQTTRRFRVALAQELDGWQNDGLIGADVASTIAARYPVLNQSSRMITILLIIGVVLVGLGVLLFVGANWDTMSRLAKLGIIVGAVLTSYVGAWRCKYEPGNHPKLGSALLLLGSLLYGASIWLISQIFNFDTNLSDGFALWALGTAALSLVTESKATSVLLALLVPAWNIAHIDLARGLFGFVFNGTFHHAGFLLTFITTTALTALVCAKAGSRAALYVLFFVSSFWVAFTSETSWVGMVLFGTFLFATHFWLEEKHKWLSSPFTYIGAGSVLLGCFVGTLDNHWGTSTGALYSTNLMILIGLAIVPTLRVMSQKTRHTSELIACLALVVAVALIGHFHSGPMLVVANNFLMLTVIAGVIAAGVHLQKPALVNLAIIFAVIDIIGRYFDMFFPMLDRSIFFIGGGLVLICAGAIAERNRRKLTGSITQLRAEAA